jgi:hypothetical protein
LAALAACVLAACGGGGGDGADGGGGSGGVGGTGIISTVSTGVMTKGSTIVNGVRFEDNAATITIDDTPKTAAQLQDGMVVKLVGSVNADGINGTAQRIKALVEVRGTPTLVSATASPPTLVVNGQTVLVDDQTVFSNAAGLGAIVQGTTFIEVHGLRDSTGRIRATRIEDNALQMGANTDEIRGMVTGGTGADPRTFTLGGKSINALNAVITPAGANWQNGSVVEVYCSARPCIVGSGPFQASLLKVEDAQDAAFQPASGQRMEAEGLVSGFAGQTFAVGNTPVTTTSSTRFEGGIATDLANNVKVEAEGSWDGTRLVASKIEFKRSVIRLQGNVTSVVGTTFTINVAGAARPVTIRTDTLTSGLVPPVNTPCVQVRGQRTGSGTPPVVTAGEITNCSNSGRPVLQAPVEAENGATLTLLGFEIDVSNPVGEQPQWEDANGGMTLSAFLNAVTPATTNAGGSVPGTLVKVIFNEVTNTVRQAEIED